jgi:putative flippase GtrA
VVTRRGSNILPEGQHPVRHGLGFVVSGATAFAVDAVVLELLTAVLDIHPIIARLAAISLAMVAGWLMHRTFTFAVAARPSVAEFLRYAGVAWTAAAINYGVFVLIVLIDPELEPLVALVVSSLAAMLFSYLGMRFAAFRQRSSTPRD